MTQKNHKKYWESIYKEVPHEELPWNSEFPSPELVELVENKKIKPCKVLDLGCGTGTNSIYIAENGFKVTGIDISEIAIKSAKEKDKGKKCRFICANALNLHFKDNEFDFLYDRGCFHSISKKDLKKYVLNVKRVLKQGGNFQLLCFAKDLRLLLNLRRILRILSPDEFPNFFSKRKISKLFSRDFEIKELKKIKIKLRFPYVEIFYSCFMVKK